MANRAKLAAAAEISGLSISEEIERRLDKSFWREQFEQEIMSVDIKSIFHDPADGPFN